MNWLVVLVVLAGPLWAEFRAGTGRVAITPPAGAPMAGYYYNRGATGTHDELFAKALVLESGADRVALVACDLIGLPRTVIDAARHEIEKETGIPARAVMISATHAHTGPIVLGGPDRYNLQGDMLAIARRYADQLPGRIAETVRQAVAGLRPARLSAGAGNEPSLIFNRRFYMKDGSVGWNPGKRNPNILRPAGPIDPEVPVLLVETSDGTPLATYVNYALHLDTVGGLDYSADYPHTVAGMLARVRGADMLTLFTIGAAGNLNHLDVSNPRPQKGHDEAARIGTVLAGEVLKTYTRLVPVSPGPILARMETVLLPVRATTPAEVEWALGVVPRFGAANAAPFLDLVRAFRVIEVDGRRGRPIEAEVQVIRIGNEVAWVGLPGEVFTELGLAIKKNSSVRWTVIVELANGSVGYVPDGQAYSQGAYEVVSARVAEGAGELLVAAALGLLR